MKLFFNKEFLDLTDPKIAKVIGWDTNIITHAGRFHADDVFSVALTILVRELFHEQKYTMDELVKIIHRAPRIEQIVNMDKKDLENIASKDWDNSLYLDLFGGDFDHHFTNPDDLITVSKDSKTTVTLATFGTMWHETQIGAAFNNSFKVRQETIDKAGLLPVHESVFWKNIGLIDNRDNYGPSIESPISDIIAHMNLNESDDNIMKVTSEKSLECMEAIQQQKFENFLNAVLFAKNILQGWIIQEQNVFTTLENLEKSKVHLETNEFGFKFLVVEENEKAFINPDIVKTIYPDVKVLINENPDSRDGSFRAVAIDSESWKFPAELIDNPAEGQKFIHGQRFLMSFETLEHLRMFMKTLK